MLHKKEHKILIIIKIDCACFSLILKSMSDVSICKTLVTLILNFPRHVKTYHSVKAKNFIKASLSSDILSCARNKSKKESSETVKKKRLYECFVLSVHLECASLFQLRTFSRPSFHSLNIHKTTC